MADVKPLSDRALKYGRNTMAIAGTIIVLAWVPEIEVEKFEPFGFEISAGEALPIWGVLCAVLIYYFISFMFAAWVDIPFWRHEERTNLTALRSALAEKRQALGTNAETQNKAALRNTRALRFSQWRMWADVGAATVLSILAMGAGFSRIVGLWPP